MRCGTEAVEADSLRISGQAVGPVADQPCAQEWRRLHVRKAVGQREAVALVGDRLLREAAVDVVAGEARLGAEVLPPAQAVVAAAAGPGEPRHSEPLSHGKPLRALPQRAYGPDDLMAEHERHVRSPELAVQDVEIGAAHAAGVHGET